MFTGRANARRLGISTAAVVGVVVIIVVIGVLGAYFVLTPSSSSSNSLPSTSSSRSITTVDITIPAGAFNEPSGWSSSNNSTLGGVVSDSFFAPANLTLVIGVNNTVVWKDMNAIVHSVTSTSVPSGASSFNFQLNSNTTAPYTLTVPGHYYYHCIYHPWMGGEITVLSEPSS